MFSKIQIEVYNNRLRSLRHAAKNIDAYLRVFIVNYDRETD